ncbi:hypothetical protein [Helicobacter vulpis]|uniref:hypothetical protein n=1 Tax=Helicobacter vulpis TaxID=2316076 RepID=UPI0013CDF97F|nr:hypothetical protein [Helicobacter vulpis]
MEDLKSRLHNEVIRLRDKYQDTKAKYEKELKALKNKSTKEIEAFKNKMNKELTAFKNKMDKESSRLSKNKGKIRQQKNKKSMKLYISSSTHKGKRLINLGMLGRPLTNKILKKLK